MEMTPVKCEVNTGVRRRVCSENNETRVVKNVKRRRREPIVGDTSTSTNTESKEQQQVDGSSATSTTTTTTTIKRSSRFRGVSRHRWTGRFEAHLWDKGSWNVTQKKKGKQVYLGAYDDEECAARAYDLAALKYWGPTTFTNFPVTDYEKEIQIMQNVTKEEYLASLRRKSSGFSRGVSKYRGVARHHHNGRWEARIGRVFGNKYLYLGTYSTQEEAAHAYDIAAIEYRGIYAVTNFDLSTYIRWLRPGTNALVPSQEQQSNSEPQTFPKSSMLIPSNSITVDESGSPRNQEALGKEISVSSCSNRSSSSPTALSLLLRSSVFRELVERNSYATNDEIDAEVARHQARVAGEDEFSRILCHRIADLPYGCPPSEDMPSIELQEDSESASPVYNQSGQSLWNGMLTMPPPMH
ncbi:hypothetical protein MKW98_022896 [Papaver atlanticum]|uniref:AP2/ERF domain-containing protein n=1 Tax=Papaver atlanticum TaxID=357466 RepID=A0AAD4XYT6_9MAGN|nr:hypothetical protein MKW98_022896 [Papaver atlanticum]